MKAVDLYLNVFLQEQKNSVAHGSEHMGIEGGTPLPPDSAGAEPAMEKVFSEMKSLLKLRHYSPRTLQTYTEWTDQFFRYAKSQRLDCFSFGTVRAWLSHLATKRNVAASTQNQAFSAVLFLFREVLKTDLPEVNAVRAKRGPKLPVVLTPEEVQKVLSCSDGTTGLMLRLTYGAGLRVSETIRLRVQDLDFGNETLLVRSGKGDKDRATTLPASLTDSLKDHLERVRALHEEDLAKGLGAVWLPGALARKYPTAPKKWTWQYVFPTDVFSTDPRSGHVRRHHLNELRIQRAVRKAAEEAEIVLRILCGIVLPRTCWKRGRMSVRCRSFLAIRM